MLKGCVCACTCVSKHVCIPKVDVHDLASPFVWRCNCEGIHILLPHLKRFRSALLQIHHILRHRKSKVELVHAINCYKRILKPGIMNNTRNDSAANAISSEFCFNINYLMNIEAKNSKPPSFGICRLDSVIVEKSVHMCSSLLYLCDAIFHLLDLGV